MDEGEGEMFDQAATPGAPTDAGAGGVGGNVGGALADSLSAFGAK